MRPPTTKIGGKLGIAHNVLVEGGVCSQGTAELV